jgi:HEAT repeat protein
MRANAHLKMTFYCPICWSEISKDDRTCEHCGADLTEADASPMVEKLCSALSHPEPETAVRAAWILGERRDKGALPELVRVIETTSDGFLAEAAAEALGKMDERALDCLRSASKHGPLRVRNAAHDAIKQILSGISRAEEKSSAP